MAPSLTSTLRRFGCFVPSKGPKSWKVFEQGPSGPPIIMTMFESGHLLVLRGQETLGTISLNEGSNSLKVQHKNDNLMFRFTVKGENCMMRMQFAGSSTAEALNQCSRAVEKLMEYVPVTAVEVSATHPNQPPTEDPPAAQQSRQEETGQGEAGAVQGAVSIRRLTQHFMGEAPLALPNIYRHNSFALGDMEAFLRVCLLDPSFPAFVEKVQEELEKLTEE
ncbi:PREDICTED: meiotic recombination protein REC114 [Cyprinodon variegatus]|uniref:meiotic recombination protein REC114 n=1 Tax=Cyprinodon variegatus TaxID=28743 RepID=UPI000742A02E|nr:PREDICTED: meiotic recombination protein REC114 [Cyprinodon variegatus]